MGAAIGHARPAAARIPGGRALRGCDHALEVPSAQVKSALLLAGLYAAGPTRVREPGISRDHTERMLEAFGVAYRAREHSQASRAATLAATRIEVPGDFSSAAFFIVAGLIAGRAPLTIRDVGFNPTRTALIDILRLMGADIRLHGSRMRAGEPRADIEVRPSGLRGIVVPQALVPIALDELPVLFAAAAVADGETVVTGAAELRVKESDRLAAMADGLESIGVEAIACRMASGLRRAGFGGVVDSRGDHRVAMAFAVLGARAAHRSQSATCRMSRPRSRGLPSPRRQRGSSCGGGWRGAGHCDRWTQRLRQGHDRAPRRAPARLAPAGQRRPVPPGGAWPAYGPCSDDVEGHARARRHSTCVSAWTAQVTSTSSSLE